MGWRTIDSLNHKIEVGHCIECCKKMNEMGYHKCNSYDPNIEHLPKERCNFCGFPNYEFDLFPLCKGYMDEEGNYVFEFGVKMER